MIHTEAAQRAAEKQLFDWDCMTGRTIARVKDGSTLGIVFTDGAWMSLHAQEDYDCLEITTNKSTQTVDAFEIGMLSIEELDAEIQAERDYQSRHRARNLAAHIKSHFTPEEREQLQAILKEQA